MMSRAFEINSYKKIKELVSKQDFNKLRILQTGGGNVAKGSMEVLKHANIKQISINDYLNKKYDEAVFCTISTEERVERIDGKSDARNIALDLSLDHHRDRRRELIELHFAFVDKDAGIQARTKTLTNCRLKCTGCDVQYRLVEARKRSVR